MAEEVIAINLINVVKLGVAYQFKDCVLSKFPLILLYWDE